MNTRKLALVSILASIALAISIIESFIPSILPGVKFGFSNIIILITLYEIGLVETIFIDVIKVLITSLIRGTFLSMPFFMSLTGAIFSLLIMILFFYLIKSFSIVGVSVLGSIFHVGGQILVSLVYFQSSYIMYYMPIIGISSIITGVIVGIVSYKIIKSGVIKRRKEKYRQ